MDEFEFRSLQAMRFQGQQENFHKTFVFHNIANLLILCLFILI